jgi:hypothetical protein
VVAPSGDLARGQPYTAAQCPRYPGLDGPNCASRHVTRRQLKDAVIQALVDHLTGADSTNGGDVGAVDKLKQRLAIVDVLLTPALRSVGVGR